MIRMLALGYRDVAVVGMIQDTAGNAAAMQKFNITKTPTLFLLKNNPGNPQNLEVTVCSLLVSLSVSLSLSLSLSLSVCVCVFAFSKTKLLRLS